MVNILSIKVADAAVVRARLTMYRRRRNDYIKCRKFELSQGFNEPILISNRRNKNLALLIHFPNLIFIKF